MAKRLVKWNPVSEAAESGVLNVSFIDTDKALSFPIANIPDSVRTLLLVNGLKQKLADCAADPDVDNFLAYQEMYAQLCNGTYSERSTSGATGPRLGVFPSAYRRFLAENGIELSIEDVRAKIKEKSEAWIAAKKKGTWLAAMKAQPRMVELIREEEAARQPATSVDLTADDLL